MEKEDRKGNGRKGNGKKENGRKENSRKENSRKENDRGKSIFAGVFLAVLFLFSLCNLLENGRAIQKRLEEEGFSLKQAEKFTKKTEEIMNEELLFRYPMIEGYGKLNHLLGKQEDNGFTTVRGKDGALYGANFWNGFGDDQKELAVRTRRLLEQLKREGTKMGAVLYPMKLPQKEEQYPGIPYSDYTSLAAEMAAWLRYYDVPLLDLNSSEKFYRRMTGKQIFFRTDHHWTPEASWESYCMILDWLNEQMDAGLDKTHKLRDPEYYVKKTYPGYMLGSQGRKTGIVYAGGSEDYTVVYPETGKSYTLRRGTVEYPVETSGTFREALLCIEEPDSIYDGAGESVYLYSGVEPYVSILNSEAETEKSILLLRDSFSTPVGAFLAQSFARVDMLWTLAYDADSLEEFLKERRYDYVLVAIYPENLQKGAFPFGMEERME